jgi:beta-lactamase regulating signal transducer with metallopeptidase domain
MVGFLIELIVRGVVLCLLTVITLLWLRRTAAAYRHLFCVLALFGLLVLPLAQRLIPPLVVRTPPHAAPPERGAVATQMPQKPLSGTKSATLIAHDSALIPRNRWRAEIAASPERSRNATSVLLVIWGIGTSLLLMRLRVALFRLHKLKQESRKVLLGNVPIWVSDQARTPLTFGIRPAVILLPATLVSGEAAVCDSALRHEQAHIARWDWLWNLFAEIVCALYWFQPGAWWLRRRLRLESERACDDRVLLSGIAGPDYAAHLLEIIRSVGTTEVAPAMAQSGGMENRMKYILDTRIPRRAKTKWLAASAPFALALLSLTGLRVSARPAEVPRQADGGTATRKSNMSLSQPTQSANPGDPPGTDAPQVIAPPRDRLENIVWGKTVGGFQLGVRLAGNVSVFTVGDTVKFEVFGRNLSGKDAHLTIGNYWKVNYKIQVETRDGKPIYWDRDQRNRAELVAGYRVESLRNGETRSISEARLKIAPPLPKSEPVPTGEDALFEVVSLKPGRYRVRLVSWGPFGSGLQEPSSGWIPIDVKRTMVQF